MEKRYVMGDIHGNARAMVGLLDYVDPDPEELVLIGDLINRGLDSWGVLEETALLVDEGATVIRGNHDLILPAFVAPNTSKQMFLDEKVGSYPTYVSIQNAIKNHGYDKVKETIAKIHHKMVYYHEDPNYIFAHAGIDPRIPYMDQQRPEVLVSGCAGWKSSKEAHCYDQYVVYGHTPTWMIHRDIEQDDARVWMSHRAKKIAIDTGAGFGEKLTLLDLLDGIAYSYDVVTRKIDKYRFKRGEKY